jgi:hypothetical protein
MSLAEDKDLTEPAARLARSAPGEWREFLEAFRKYTDARKDNCVLAQLDELQRSQGRAQQCVQLVALLSDAIKSADRMHERKMATQKL